MSTLIESRRPQAYFLSEIVTISYRRGVAPDAQRRVSDSYSVGADPHVMSSLLVEIAAELVPDQEEKQLIEPHDRLFDHNESGA
jgi:hypothetical protein